MCHLTRSGVARAHTFGRFTNIYIPLTTLYKMIADQQQPANLPVGMMQAESGAEELRSIH